MLTKRLVSIVAIVAILGSLLAPIAQTVVAQAPAKQGTYLLVLDIPAVEVPDDAAAIDVPGYYLGAVSQQFSEVEATLDAMLTAGYISGYTPLPKANAFEVVATPQATSTLSRLGSLSSGQGRSGSLEAAFESQLDAIFDAAFEQNTPATALSEAPSQAPAQSEARAEIVAVPADSPTSRDTVVAVQPEANDWLVKLNDTPEAEHVAGFIGWLVSTEDWVVSQEWLPDANAIRVTMYGDGDLLAQHPGVLEVVPFSEAASRNLIQPRIIDVVVPSTSYAVGTGGTLLVHMFTVTQTGPITTYNLTVLTDTWALTIRDTAGGTEISEIEIPANGSASFVVEVEVPADALAGDSDSALLEIENQGNPFDDRLVSLSSYTPDVDVTLDSNFFSGWVTPSSEYTVTLSTGMTVKAQESGASSTSGSFGLNLDDIYDNDALAKPGDTVEVTDETGIVMTVEVPNITALANPNNDTVTGIAPANISSTDFRTPPNLLVDVSIFTRTTTNASGVYNVGRGDVGDFDPNDFGLTRYRNAEGYEITRNFRVPFVDVRGYRFSFPDYEADNYVAGRMTFNSLVTVDLLRGGTVIDTEADLSNSFGEFEVRFNDIYGNAIDIEAGDTVRVRDGIMTMTVDVPAFNITSNPDTDVVAGTTDATLSDTTTQTETAEIYPRGLELTSFPNAVITQTSFSIDFSESPYFSDILPGDEGYVEYRDSNQNYVYDDFQAPGSDITIYARGDGDEYRADNFVRGIVPGCNSGDLATLSLSGSNTASVQVNCSGGEFSIVLTDIYGTPINIAAGDTIQVSYEGESVSLTIPTLTATSDPDTDIVTGNTNATVVTDTFGLTQTLGVWSDSTSDFGFPSLFVIPTSGSFTADFSSIENIFEGERGHLRYIDADGNYVYSDFIAISEHQIFVRGGSGGYVADNYVEVQVAGGFGTDGTITLKDSSDNVKDQLTYSSYSGGLIGGSFTGPAGEAIDIEAGDKVEADFNGIAVEVTVPTLSATSDPDTDIVTGNTNATVVTDTFGLTQTLGVWSDSTSDFGFPSLFVIPTSGNFTADFSSLEDIFAGARGHLRYIDADNNFFYEDFVAPRDAINARVHKDDNDVSGTVLLPNTDVTVTLQDSDGNTKATAFDVSNSSGNFDVNLFGPMGAEVTIDEGDTVEVVAGSETITVPVVPLSATANIDTDVVSGVGPANSVVEVDSGDELSAATDNAGNFSADFSGIDDQTPGEYIQVEYTNTDGNDVYIDFYAGPDLLTLLNSNLIWGYGLFAGETITVTLADSSGTTKAVETVETSSSHFFNAFMVDSTSQRVMVEADDQITVEFSDGSTAQMTAVALAATVNTDTDIVSGTAPANDAVEVSINSYEETVSTDGSGNFSADASDDTDIEPGNQAFIRHLDANLYETWLYATAPIYYVRGNTISYVSDNYVSGYSTRVSGNGDVFPVDVSLQRNGQVVATARDSSTNTNGFFAVSLPDVTIMAGDEVVVDGTTITVPTLDGTADTEANTVTGTGPASSEIGLENNSTGEDVTASTSANGSYTASFEQGIANGHSIELKYRNAAQSYWVYNIVGAAGATGDVTILARWNGSGVETNAVYGNAGIADATVTVNLQRGGSTIATVTYRTSTSGFYDVTFTDANDDAVPILAGDTIQLVTPDGTFSMVVASLTAQVNSETGVLYGTAPTDGGLLSYGGFGSGSLEVDANGEYYVAIGAFNGEGYIRYADGTYSGYQTYLPWAEPFVRVYQGGNTVNGTVEANTAITVAVRTSSGQTLNTTTTESNDFGNFTANLLENNTPFIINAGTTVWVYAGSVISVPVPAMTATIALDTDLVSGFGPTQTNLAVDVFDEFGGSSCGNDVETAADGTFTVGFNGDCDITNGYYVLVTYTNDDGNRVYIRTDAPPLLKVNVTENVFSGRGSAYEILSLMLNKQGTVTGTYETSVKADDDGRFHGYFADADGNVVDIAEGDIVQLAGSGEATLATLSVSLNATNDTVTVSGPNNALVLLRVFVWVGSYSQIYEETIVLDGSGSATVTIDDADLTNSSYAYVSYTGANEVRTIASSTPSESVLVNSLVNTAQASGTIFTSKSGSVEDEGFSAPLVYEAEGAENLVIYFTGDQLLITAPDGSQTFTTSNPYTSLVGVTAGTWMFQSSSSTDGNAYAVVIAGQETLREIYLPIIQRQDSQ